MRWEFVRLFKRTKENFSEAFSEFFSDFGAAFYELFVQIPKDVKIFAKTLWAYKGILWSDRDYDHAFILVLLQFKIRRTKEYMAKWQRHTRWKLDVANMQKAEDMIETILTSSYDKELVEAHDAKWGPSHHYHLPVPNGTGSFLRSDRPNIRTPEDKKKERQEYSKMLDKMIKSEEKAWHKLWTHLDKHLREWWD